MICSFWDIECDRLKLAIMGHFLAFTLPPLKTKKIRILKKWKEFLERSSFYTSPPKTKIRWGTFPEIWSETERIFCYFGPFFVLYTPLTTTKIKILKQWKKHLEMPSVKNHKQLIYASCSTTNNSQSMVNDCQ